MDPHDPNDILRSKVEKVPREVFFNIFSRLSLKSVIRSSCVSKSWLDMIKDPYFVKLHVTRSEPETSLLILKHRVLGEKNVISISHISCRPPYLNADETAIDHMVSSFSWHLVGTCDGLLCFTSFGDEEVTMVCNPITREHIILPKPAIGLSSESHVSVLAFGFDHVAKAYKVVRVISHRTSRSLSGPRRVERVFIPDNQVEFNADRDNRAVFHADHGAEFLDVPDAHLRRSASHGALMRAEVYTLGTASWREVQGCNYPCLHGKSVYANGAVYWLVDHFDLDDRILSFDLGSEQFKLTPHPCFGGQISLAELRGCLAVVDLSSSAYVEISVLKDPSDNFWELADIIPLDKFGQQMGCRDPRLICVHELKNGILIWLQDNLLLYDKKTWVKRHPRLSGFPTWLNWKICSGYRASLVPLGNSCGTGDDMRDVVRFISDWELSTLLLRGVSFGGQEPDDWCEQVVASFQQNGMLI